MELDEWPPPDRDNHLEFWTWEHYWGNQARAFQHVGDLESIAPKTVPEYEQYRRLSDGEAPDVVHFTSKQFDRAVSNGLLEPIPVERLPSWPPENDLRVHDTSFYERDGNYYGLPQTPLAYALAYNRYEYDEPDTWALLWDESLEGRISMPAEPVLSGQLAAIYAGEDPSDPSDFGAIRNALAAQQPLLANYWEDWHDCWTEFENGDLLAGALPYTPMCLCSHDESPVRRTAPEEGVLYSLNTFSIPRGAENPYSALEFIDWGREFKTGTELTWNANDWTLHHAEALDSDVRDTYESIGQELGIEPGPME